MLGQMAFFLGIWRGDRLSCRKLKRLSSKRLRRMIRHAYETVPFYRKLWDAHKIGPDSVRITDDIVQLPIINKAMVKQAGKQILSQAYPVESLLTLTTSGSTGKPVKIYRNKSFEHLIAASKLRSYFANGYSLSDKIAVWNMLGPKPKIYHRFGIHREENIRRDTPLEKQFAVLKEKQPEIFATNASQLLELGRYLKQNQLALEYKPKRIFTDSENLMPGIRTYIHESFGTYPRDIYGSREFGLIAWQCEKRSGYHLNSDLLHVEILDPLTGQAVGEGKSGQVVITDFFNFGSPLIRFNIEDIAVFTREKCSCGRNLPMIKEIEGREYDYVVLPSGDRISGPVFLALSLREFLDIEQFQGTLDTKNHLTLRLKIEQGKTIDEAKIIEALQEHFKGLTFSIMYVDRFEIQHTRKFRPFINNQIPSDNAFKGHG